MPPADPAEALPTTCDQVSDRMSGYLDHELEPALARRISLHLERCPGCARLAAELALTIAALRRLAPRGLTPACLGGHRKGGS